MRINKYISTAGICSRREADKKITDNDVEAIYDLMKEKVKLQNKILNILEDHSDKTNNKNGEEINKKLKRNESLLLIGSIAPDLSK